MRAAEILQGRLDRLTRVMINPFSRQLQLDLGHDIDAGRVIQLADIKLTTAPLSLVSNLEQYHAVPHHPAATGSSQTR